MSDFFLPNGLPGHFLQLDAVHRKFVLDMIWNDIPQECFSESVKYQRIERRIALGWALAVATISSGLLAIFTSKSPLFESETIWTNGMGSMGVVAGTCLILVGGLMFLFSSNFSKLLDNISEAEEKWFETAINWRDLAVVCVLQRTPAWMEQLAEAAVSKIAQSISYDARQIFPVFSIDSSLSKHELPPAYVILSFFYVKDGELLVVSGIVLDLKKTSKSLSSDAEVVSCANSVAQWHFDRLAYSEIYEMNFRSHDPARDTFKDVEGVFEIALSSGEIKAYPASEKYIGSLKAAIISQAQAIKVGESVAGRKPFLWQEERNKVSLQFCPDCGAGRVSGSNFCHQCGKAL